MYIRRALLRLPPLMFLFGAAALLPLRAEAQELAEDDDNDGIFRFRQVLGPGDGLLIPVDMLLSYDHKYMYLTNWFGNTVQQFDVTNPFRPVLTATVPVPHPNMLRLSRDNKRLYVSNSLLTP